MGNRVTHSLADSVRHSQTDILAVEDVESQGEVAAFVWELSQRCQMEPRV